MQPGTRRAASQIPSQPPVDFDRIVITIFQRSREPVLDLDQLTESLFADCVGYFEVNSGSTLKPSEPVEVSAVAKSAPRSSESTRRRQSAYEIGGNPSSDAAIRTPAPLASHVPPILATDLVESVGYLTEAADLSHLHERREDIALFDSYFLQTLQSRGSLWSVALTEYLPRSNRLVILLLRLPPHFMWHPRRRIFGIQERVDSDNGQLPAVLQRLVG